MSDQNCFYKVLFQSRLEQENMKAGKMIDNDVIIKATICIKAYIFFYYEFKTF